MLKQLLQTFERLFSKPIQDCCIFSSYFFQTFFSNRRLMNFKKQNLTFFNQSFLEFFFDSCNGLSFASLLITNNLDDFNVFKN